MLGSPSDELRRMSDKPKVYRPAAWEGVLQAAEDARSALRFEEREERFSRGHAHHN
jgi:hypothetical protein